MVTQLTTTKDRLSITVTTTYDILLTGAVKVAVQRSADRYLKAIGS